MRRIAITLLALVYPAILLGTYIVPGAGVRRSIELSVARDGSFTVATAHGATFGGIRIDYWAADLSTHRRVELSKDLEFWAHSISADGTHVGAVTTEGNREIIEVVNLEDESDRQLYSLPVEIYSSFDGFSNSLTCLYFCRESTSCFVARNTSRTFVFGGGGETLTIESAVAHSLPILSGAKYLLVSNLLPARINAAGDNVHDRECSFYAVTDNGLELLSSKKRRESDFREYGTLITPDGTIAFQFDDYIEFTNRKDEKRRLAWPVDEGWLYEMDPTNSHLLMRKENSLFVVDALTGKIVARRSFEKSDRLQRFTFQDGSHILFLLNSVDDPRQLQSDQIVRWNWRDDFATQKSVGGTDAITNDRQLILLACAILIWVLIALAIARTSQRWITPAVLLLAMMALSLTWVYCDPSHERSFFHDEIGLPWLVFVLTWLTFAFLSTLAITKLKASALRRAALLIFALTLSAERLHGPMSIGNWFLPLVAFLSCTTTAVAIVVLGVGRAQMKSKSDRYSFALADLILLTAAVAVLIATLSHFDAFDLNTRSMTWMLADSAAFAAVGTLAIWSGVGDASWWKRYPILLVITLGLAYAISFAWWIVVFLIDGSICAVLLIAVSCTLAISTWMFRGVTADSQHIEADIQINL